MTDKDWLEKVKLAAKVYNEGRMCRDFQEEEVNKFVEWIFKQYGVVYESSGNN